MTAWRAQTPTPTELGWYYGRRKDPLGHIQPMRIVMGFGDNLLAVRVGALHPLSHFDWFGPIAECKEG